nr:hypothetical protein [uncultured Sphaerochaeta sp.]
MNYDLLFSNNEGEKVELAIIGVKGFNHSLFVYGSRSSQVSIRVLCGRNVQTCIDAYTSIGISEQDIVHVSDEQQGLHFFGSGKYLVFDDVSLAMKMPINVVVEGTGNPEAAARFALSAIENKKHVIMVTKEADSVIGSLLAAKAREQGVIYSLAEGDQPSLLVGLVTWVKTAGLKIVSIGKASEYDFVYDVKKQTIKVMEREIVLKEFASCWDLGDDPIATIKKRSFLLSSFGQRAIPDLAEMAIVSNHLPQFNPDIESFHCPISRAIEVPDLMCTKEMGGLFSDYNRIDVINCLRRSDEQSLEGGVYVVVECDDEETWKVLQEKGTPVSRNGRCALIYYPAHYLGFEALFSVLSVGRLGLPTGSNNPTPRYDLVARATCDAPKGTHLRALGHHHVIDGFEAILRPARSIDENVQLPYYLADNMVLNQDVKAGELLTANMLVENASAILWALRREQDDLFLKKG